MAKYGYRDITDVMFFDLATGNPVVFMDYLQTASQAFGSEIVYARGGRGSPKLVGFQSNNSMEMEMNSPLITPELLGIMFGSTVVTGQQYVPVTQLITDANYSFEIASTPYTGDLTTYPITCSYAPDSTTPSVILEKVVSSTPATDEFSVSARVVTVNSTAYANGGTFLVTYYVASSANNKRVPFQSDKFSKAYKVTGYTLWKNTADSLEYPCRITIPKLQINIDGNTLQSAMEGDPSTFILKGEALKPDNTTDLIIYDIDED
jgi:hypothetical protein